MPRGSCKVRLRHSLHTFVQKVAKCEDEEDVEVEEDDESSDEDTVADMINKDGRS